MNFDFQMGVWGFKRIRNFGEVREKKKTRVKLESYSLSLRVWFCFKIWNWVLFLLLPSLWGFWGFVSWNLHVKTNGKFYLDFIGSPYNLERGQDEPPPPRPALYLQSFVIPCWNPCFELPDPDSVTPQINSIKLIRGCLFVTISQSSHFPLLALFPFWQFSVWVWQDELTLSDKVPSHRHGQCLALPEMEEGVNKPTLLGSPADSFPPRTETCLFLLIWECISVNW